MGGRLGEAHVEVRDTRQGRRRRSRAASPASRSSLTLFDSPKLRGLRRAACSPDGGRRSSPSPARWRSSCPAALPAALHHGFRRRRFGQIRAICRRRAPARCAGSTAARATSCSPSRRATAERADLCLFVSEAEAALFRAAHRPRQHPRAFQRHRRRPFRSGGRFPAPRYRGRAAAPVHRPDGLCAQCRARSPGSPARCCRCVPARPLRDRRPQSTAFGAGAGGRAA